MTGIKVMDISSKLILVVMEQAKISLAFCPLNLLVFIVKAELIASFGFKIAGPLPRFHSLPLTKQTK